VPFVYFSHTKQVAENYTTSGTANTEIDFSFLKPGASRAAVIKSLLSQGKAAGLSALSGIVLRLKQWTTTASAAGTATTPAPKNNLAPACVATAGMGTGGGTAAVTSGTGGPSLAGMASMGVSGPGAWAAQDADDVPTLDGGAAKSMDLFSASPTISLNFECGFSHQEA
jgi:hypothetical protein